MSPEQWKRVEELFHEASELPDGQREAFLDRTCADSPAVRTQVDKLLASDSQGAGQAVKQQVVRGLLDFHAAAPAIAKEKRVGPYRLVREIGRGGMGTVYLAERADDQYESQVAIKLVRPGLDTEFFLTRFRRERQTLAKLNHPNIARLLDSGTTDDGLPYIVMEYIDGVHITDYVFNRKLAVDAIIRLIRPVCDAVAHAHQQFVVHRDIKPGNILVDKSGAPKLLDFGVCKLTEPGLTATMTEIIVTPDYGSPEQVRGEEITAASDVYSLGAVLYELLTRKPVHVFDKLTPQRIHQVICDGETKRPSQVVTDKFLARKLTGDLDNILLRALQKDPQRRYESVEQFAADLDRYLEDRPVLARPDTLRYRTRKFVVRNRAPLLTALTVAGALTFATVVSIQEAATARKHFQAARELANAFVFDVHDEIKNLPGSVRARQKILAIGLKYLDSLASDAKSDAPLRQELAAAYERIGEVQGNVLGSNTGETTAGIRSLQKSINLLESLPPTRERDVQRAGIYNRMGDFLWGTKEADKAMGAYKQALQITDALLGSTPDDSTARKRRGNVLLAVGRLQRDSLDWTGSLASTKEAKEMFEQELQRHPEDREVQASFASATSNLANAYFGLEQLEKAKEEFLSATRQWDALSAFEPLNTYYRRQRMLAYSHLGDLLGNPNYRNLGDWEGARAAFTTMTSIAKAMHESDPADRGAYTDYGMALMHSAAIPDSKPLRKLGLLQSSGAILADVSKAAPSNLSPALNLASIHEQIGDLYVEMKEPDKARQAYQQSIATAKDLIGIGRISSARIFITSGRKLAEIEARRGAADEALAIARKTVEVGERLTAAPNAPTGQKTLAPRAYAAMGSVCSILGRPAEARQWREKALSGFRSIANHKEFTLQHRQEMQALEDALRGSL